LDCYLKKLIQIKLQQMLLLGGVEILKKSLHHFIQVGIFGKINFEKFLGKELKELLLAKFY